MDTAPCKGGVDWPRGPDFLGSSNARVGCLIVSDAASEIARLRAALAASEARAEAAETELAQA